MKYAFMGRCSGVSIGLNLGGRYVFKLDRVGFKENSPRLFPMLAGIYILSSEGKWYVGSSSNLFRRLRTHNREWDFSICYCLSEADTNAEAWENHECLVNLSYFLSQVKTRNCRLDFPIFSACSLASTNDFVEKTLLPSISRLLNHGIWLGITPHAVKSAYLMISRRESFV